jgi:hypothetical protein
MIGRKVGSIKHFLDRVLSISSVDGLAMSSVNLCVTKEKWKNGKNGQVCPTCSTEKKKTRAKRGARRESMYN